MTARSFADAADMTLSRNRATVIIGGQHPLNDPNPPRFGSDRDLGASLLSHIKHTLVDGTENEAETYWRELQAVAQNVLRSLPNSQNIRARVNTRFTNALSSTTINLTDSQIDATVDFVTARRQLRDALDPALPVARRDEIINALVVEAQKIDGVSPAADNPVTAEMRALMAMPAFAQMKDAVAAIYSDTAQNFAGRIETAGDYEYRVDDAGRITDVGTMNDAGEIVPVPAAQRLSLVSTILRSTVEIDQDTDRMINLPANELQLVDQANAGRLAIMALVNDAVQDPAQRAELVGYLDARARGENVNAPPAILATSYDRQIERHNTIAQQDPLAVGGIEFSDDLMRLATDIMESPAFQNYAAAIADFDSNPVLMRTLADRQARAQALLSDVDVVMATPQQALVMQAWMAYAISAGPGLPSVEQLKVASNMIASEFERPVVKVEFVREASIPTFHDSDALLANAGIRTVKYNAYRHTAYGDDAKKLLSAMHRPEFARVRNKVTSSVKANERIVRHAIRGPEATALRFPTIGVELFRFYKNEQALTDFTNAIVAQNKSLPPHKRASLVSIETVSSNGHDLFSKAVKASGMETIAVYATQDSSARAVVTDGEKKLVSDRKIKLTVKIGGADGEEVDFYSREGQRAARGKHIEIVPRLSARDEEAIARSNDENRENRRAGRLRMIGWQALVSVSASVNVFGDQARDHGVAQIARRADELGRTLTVFDQHGKAVDLLAFLPEARLGAPSPAEIAQSKIADEAGRPSSDPVVQTMIARLAGPEAAAVVATGVDRLGQLVGMLQTPASDIKNIDPDDKRLINAIASTIQPAIPTLRDPVKLNRALQDAAREVDEMDREGLTQLLRGRAVGAAGRRLFAHGDTKVVNDAYLTAIIGGQEALTPSTREAIDATVASIGRTPNQAVVTIAESGVGAAVIEAAIKAEVPVVVMSRDRAMTDLPLKTQLALERAFTRGQATAIYPTVTASDPSLANNDMGDKRSRPMLDHGMSRTQTLTTITQMADGVVLAAARARDVATLVAVETGQARPVAVLAPKPDALAQMSGNAILMRNGGTVSAEVGRGGNRIVPAATGEIGPDGLLATNSAPPKVSVEPYSQPIIRAASFTQAATVLRSAQDVTSFVEATRDGTGKTLASNAMKAMTAAEMAMALGYVRAPTDAEMKETSGIAVTDQDAKRMSKKIEALAANYNQAPKKAAGMER